MKGLSISLARTLESTRMLVGEQIKGKDKLKNKVDIVMPTLIRNIDWIKQSIESIINQPEVQNIFIVVDEVAFSKISELKKNWVIKQCKNNKE